MKPFTGKAVKTALLIAVPLTISIVAYLLYNQFAPGAPAEKFARYEGTNRSLRDSINLSRLQASIDKELDSLERNPPQEWLDNYYINMLSQPAQPASPVTKRSDGAVQNRKEGNAILEGPSAIFRRRYSLRVGKPVLVSLLWAPDSSFSPVKLELVTITLTDVADDKAGFTLADASAVLLYSEAQYGVNDNISIDDKNHNFHISVMEVRPDSVKIELTSNLTDEIVSRLKGWE